MVILQTTSFCLKCSNCFSTNISYLLGESSKVVEEVSMEDGGGSEQPSVHGPTEPTCEDVLAWGTRW